AAIEHVDSGELTISMGLKEWRTCLQKERHRKWQCRMCFTPVQELRSVPTSSSKEKSSRSLTDSASTTLDPRKPMRSDGGNKKKMTSSRLRRNRIIEKSGGPLESG